MRNYVIDFRLGNEICRVYLFKREHASVVLRGLMNRGAVDITVTGPAEFGPDQTFTTKVDEQTLQVIERCDSIAASTYKIKES